MQQFDRFADVAKSCFVQAIPDIVAGVALGAQIGGPVGTATAIAMDYVRCIARNRPDLVAPPTGGLPNHPVEANFRELRQIKDDTNLQWLPGAKGNWGELGKDHHGVQIFGGGGLINSFSGTSRIRNLKAFKRMYYRRGLAVGDFWNVALYIDGFVDANAQPTANGGSCTPEGSGSTSGGPSGSNSLMYRSSIAKAVFGANITSDNSKFRPLSDACRWCGFYRIPLRSPQGVSWGNLTHTSSAGIPASRRPDATRMRFLVNSIASSVVPPHVRHEVIKRMSEYASRFGHNFRDYAGTADAIAAAYRGTVSDYNDYKDKWDQDRLAPPTVVTLGAGDVTTVDATKDSAIDGWITMYEVAAALRRLSGMPSLPSRDQTGFPLGQDPRKIVGGI